VDLDLLERLTPLQVQGSTGDGQENVVAVGVVTMEKLLVRRIQAVNLCGRCDERKGAGMLCFA
jgi:hypothetical protein